MELEPNTAGLDWPLAPGERGREVWYLLVTTRDGTVAFWYHLEVVSTGNTNLGRSWVAIAGRDGDSVFAARPVDVGDIDARARPFALQTGEERLTSASTAGRIDDRTTVDWELEYEPDTYAFTPLRSQSLTNLLANTVGTGKHWSRNQSVQMTGTVTLEAAADAFSSYDGTISFEDAPGHQGHTVSSQSAPELTWLHCNDFETETVRADDITVEALQYGRLLSVCLRVDGEVYAFNRVQHVLPVSPRSNTVEHNELGEWRFRTRGGPIGLRATVDADDHWHHTAQFMPDGDRRYDVHCPFANLELSYSVEGDIGAVTSDRARVEWVRPEPPMHGDYRPDWH